MRIQFQGNGKMSTTQLWATHPMPSCLLTNANSLHCPLIDDCVIIIYARADGVMRGRYPNDGLMSGKAYNCTSPLSTTFTVQYSSYILLKTLKNMNILVNKNAITRFRRHVEAPKRPKDDIKNFSSETLWGWPAFRRDCDPGRPILSLSPLHPRSYSPSKYKID